MQTFFVFFHMFDTEDSDETLRYKLGWAFYMIFFFTQALLLIGTYVFAWYVYLRLAFFLKPAKSTAGPVYNQDGEYVQDDQFEDQNLSEYEKRRRIIAERFSPRYTWFNVVFAYILITLTLRTGTYVGFRMTSGEKIFEWKLIQPCVFYLTYATDVMIVFGVLYFIWSSTKLKSRYNRSDSQQVFPEAINQGTVLTTIDGD